jgi:hypothetical protein
MIVGRIFLVTRDIIRLIAPQKTGCPIWTACLDLSGCWFSTSGAPGALPEDSLQEHP